MNKQITGLHTKLMGLIDEGNELFFKERPFLTDGGDPVITELEEVTQNQMEIELTARALDSAVRKELPKILPPKQGELL